MQSLQFSLCIASLALAVCPKSSSNLAACATEGVACVATFQCDATFVSDQTEMLQRMPRPLLHMLQGLSLTWGKQPVPITNIAPQEARQRSIESPTACLKNLACELMLKSLAHAAVVSSTSFIFLYMEQHRKCRVHAVDWLMPYRLMPYRQSEPGSVIMALPAKACM